MINILRVEKYDELINNNNSVIKLDHTTTDATKKCNNYFFLNYAKNMLRTENLPPDSSLDLFLIHKQNIKIDLIGNPWDCSIITELSAEEINNSQDIITTPCFLLKENFGSLTDFLSIMIPYVSGYFELKNKIPTLEMLYLRNTCGYQSFVDEWENIIRILGYKNCNIADNKNNMIAHKQNISLKFTNVYFVISLYDGIGSNLTPLLENTTEFKSWCSDNKILLSKKNGDYLWRNTLMPFRYNFTCGDIVNKIMNNLKISNNFESKNMIYISRRSTTSSVFMGKNRVLINENDLVNELSKFGFEEHFFENYSVEEKIKLVNNCKVIILLSSSSSGNLEYLINENTLVIQICHPILGEHWGKNWYCLPDITKCISVNAGKLYGDKTSNANNQHWTVEVNKITKILEDHGISSL